MQLYVVRTKIDKSGEEEKTVYVGTPVTSNRVTEVDIAREICERSSLTEEDVLHALGAVARLLHEHLEDGSTVSLKGIGTFSVSGSTVPCATPEECTPGKMKARRICFKADKILRAVLEKMRYKRTHSKVKR